MGVTKTAVPDGPVTDPAAQTGSFIQQRQLRAMASEPTGYRFDRRQQGDGNDFGADLSTRNQSLTIDGSFRSDDALWYGWAEAVYSGYESDDTVDGHFGQLSFGADYLLRKDLVVGMMVQIDTAKETTDVSVVAGDGWIIGPYVSGKLAPNLYFNARMGLGRSSNSTTIGAASGDFDTNRSLVRGSLYGNHMVGTTKLTPMVEVIYMREDFRDYSITDGATTTVVAGGRSEIGRVSVSTKIAVPVGGMWAYTTPRLNWTTVSSAGNDTSGAIAFGLRTAPGAGWNGDFSIGFDGLARENYKGATIRAQASKNF